MRFRKEAWWDWDGSVNRAPHWRAQAKVVDDFGNLLQVQRCAQCRLWKPRDPEVFQVRSRKPTGHAETYFAWCRPCMNARRRKGNTPEDVMEKRRASSRRAYKKMRSDRERVALRREQNRLAQERWRKTSGYRETRRRYRKKVMGDDRLRERENEAQRIYYRLRREREGYPLPGGGSDTGNGIGNEVPIGPLVEFLHAQVVGFEKIAPSERREIEKRFAETFGVSLKTYYDWRNGRRKAARASTVDKILTARNRNWFDVYSKPANGHKSGRPLDVLKYIDDANVYIQACLVFEGELVE